MKKNENGFGILELLFIIMIFAAISTVGWYVLKSKTSDTTPPNIEPSVSETNQTTDQENSAYIIYDKNPNFTIAYPKNWNIKTDNEDSNNQYVFFNTTDLTATDKIYNDAYTVSRGSQFYIHITNEGLPATVEEILSTMKDGISNVADLYKAEGLSFQDPKILKTAGGIDYVSFIGHSSFMSPINNSSNALFITKKYGVTLGYIYPNRTDGVADSSHVSDFSYFIESLTLR